MPFASAAALRPREGTLSVPASAELAPRPVMGPHVLRRSRVWEAPSLASLVLLSAAFRPLWRAGKEKPLPYRSVIGLHLVLFQEDRVLLGLRKGTAWCDGWWHVPAGHLEDGESFLVGMVREAREELGIAISEDRAPSRPEPCGSWPPLPRGCAGPVAGWCARQPASGAGRKSPSAQR